MEDSRKPGNWEIDAFVGPNSGYYKKKWEHYEEKINLNLNFAALFFSIEWMIYRKMFREAISFFIFNYVVIFIFILNEVPLYVARIIFNVVLGLTGNFMYYNKMMRSLKSSDQMDMDEKKTYLKAKGGSSWLSILILMAMEIFIFMLMISEIYI